MGHREELVRNFKIGLSEGIVGAAAAQREPVLVTDVRTDPRYFNSVDAVRAELAVPMIARQKLVGVIDVQSTREGAYGEYDRSMLRLIAVARRRRHRQRASFRRAERQNRTLRDSRAHLPGIHLHPGTGRTAEQDRHPRAAT